jgi:hypothetical protein
MLALAAPVAAQEDWPVNVTFGASKTGPTTCGNGAGWCDDGKGAYFSDTRGKLVAEVVYYDSSEYEPAGGFWFYVNSASKRMVVFDFMRPVINEDATWCPDVCPRFFDLTAVPNFASDPITELTLFDTPQWSPPNYDLFTGACQTGEFDGGRCANDFALTFKTLAKKEYRLRFSPNIWRELTNFDHPDPPRNTMPYGVMSVVHPDASTWVMTPLLQHPLVLDGTGQIATEPCPAVLERKDTVKGRNTWAFLGCFDMPFEITLTRR